MIENSRLFLKILFDKAIEAANPEQAMQDFLPLKPKGRTIIVGAGKGAAQMAQTLEKLWLQAGYGALEGCVVTRYGYGAKTSMIEVMEASHPLPDENGILGAQKLMSLVTGLTEDDLVIALICGGGSALLPAPLGSMTLQDEIAVNQALLHSGAPIYVMNAIRKHLSKIKGGRLAAMAAPAQVISLIVSDIPGDILSQVSSGPTIADDLTRFDALQMIKNYHIQLPDRAMEVLNSPMADAPKPNDAIFARNSAHIVSSAGRSLTKAAQYAKQQGIDAVILSDNIEGEAKDIGLMHAAIASNIVQNDQPFKKPIVILSGGETTVSIKEKCGKGGRNSEFLLAFAQAIQGQKSITALAADTDGIDGSENNAGAFCDEMTIAKMVAKNIDPVDCLNNHDSYSAFFSIDDLLITGPTGTNVNDFRAILIV